MAAWFEREHAGELGPHLAVVAHHHRHAGNVDRAADYLERASTHAFRFGLPRQSVTLGLEGASLLGVALPTEPSAVAARIEELVAATTRLVGGRPPQALLALPAMSDPAKVRTARVLLELAPFTFQAGRPDLYALVGLTLLQLVLEHGNAAPDVYSTYSVVHRAIHGDARGAHAWSELALALDARQGGHARARVAFVHDWFHAHWLRPLRESVARSLEAAEVGLAAGDVLFGCYNLSGHLIYAAASGLPLDEVASLARAQLARNGRRVVNAAFHCVHEMQVARAIAGRTRSPLSLTDDDVDEERDVASITATDFYNQIGYYIVSRVKLHSLFGDAAGALGWADKIGPLQAAIAGQIAEIDLVLHRTLAEVDEGLLDRARAGVAEVARWTELCPANFEHLAEILRGALKAREGKRVDALASLRRAAALAEAQGFVQHAALAHERASRVDAGGEHRAAAIAAYRRWGARAKVDALESARR
jgi:predicted ATPase